MSTPWTSQIIASLVAQAIENVVAAVAEGQARPPSGPPQLCENALRTRRRVAGILGRRHGNKGR